ncbi:MAG: ATP-binding protein [Chloroflexota bacterium]
MTDMIVGSQADNTDLQSEIERLKAVNKIALMLGTTLDFEAFIEQLIAAISEYVGSERVILFVPDDQDVALEYGASNFRLPAAEKQSALENLQIALYSTNNDTVVAKWLDGTSVLIQNEPATTKQNNFWLAEALGSSSLYSCPLMLDGQIIGLALIDNASTGTPLKPSQCAALDVIAQSTAVALQNARLHRKTVLELADNMREMYIMRQIDRELNDTIDLTHVFQMTLDWALRFTNAQFASLALYNEETDMLRFMVEYGYDQTPDKLAVIRNEYGAGVTQRVARSGHAEVVPDVSTDPDFVRLASNVRSQLSVPVMREDRVIAVTTLESRKLNGFTDNHMDFVAKLATRAGVAIDNARLYEESIREREKLSHILGNTADVIVVIAPDDRVVLINESAVGAMHLYPNENYVGKPLFDTFENETFLDAYRRAKATGETITQEVLMPNERIFYANMRVHDGIGCIIVMHDITPFKEMDKLKSELIGTVSHDLKQPLGVMNGYVELLMMQQAVSPQGMNHIQMIRRAVQNMRQLIDDLLDLTKIESGIKLDLQPVPINSVVVDCLESLRPNVQNKQMTVISEINDSLPNVMGDKSRLRQVLMNLIGNAVKYTPPEGWVKVSAEPRGNMLRLTIQDNGLGISPEDQIHIFDRFYRVRRPETDSIEGTGLGLAIVKSLVEAHNGQIGLESRLGEGSTFFLTLPVVT